MDELYIIRIKSTDKPHKIWKPGQYLLERYPDEDIGPSFPGYEAVKCPANATSYENTEEAFKMVKKLWDFQNRKGIHLELVMFVKRETFPINE